MKELYCSNMIVVSLKKGKQTSLKFSGSESSSCFTAVALVTKKIL